MATLRSILSIVWEIVKIAVIPLAIWYFEVKREREYTERKRDADAKDQQSMDIQYMLMQRMDKLSEMVHLMAFKLHEKKIINGDLEVLDRKYKELDEEYEEEVRRLALLYSNSKQR